MMCKMVELRDGFRSEAVYHVYAPCMYQPTWEKFCKKADTYLQDNTITLVGAVQAGQIAGVIVLKEQNIRGHYEILGIAVDTAQRRHGIGRHMIQYAVHTLHAAELYAETDDDAVAFYRSCNFAVSTFTEEFPDGVCIRHKCVLKGSACPSSGIFA